MTAFKANEDSVVIPKNLFDDLIGNLEYFMSEAYDAKTKNCSKNMARLNI